MRGGRDGLNAAGSVTPHAGLREIDGDGAEDQAEGGDDFKKDEGLEATRPTPRSSLWPAMPVTMPPKMSGATIMRMRRRKMSPRKWVCAAKCGASTPSSAPASMAKKVHTSSERRRRA
jgi:hypothetical protein